MFVLAPYMIASVFQVAAVALVADILLVVGSAVVQIHRLSAGIFATSLFLRSLTNFFVFCNQSQQYRQQLINSPKIIQVRIHFKLVFMIKKCNQ